MEKIPKDRMKSATKTNPELYGTKKIEPFCLASRAELWRKREKNYA